MYEIIDAIIDKDNEYINVARELDGKKSNFAIILYVIANPKKWYTYNPYDLFPKNTAILFENIFFRKLLFNTENITKEVDIPIKE